MTLLRDDPEAGWEAKRTDPLPGFCSLNGESRLYKVRLKYCPHLTLTRLAERALLQIAPEVGPSTVPSAWDPHVVKRLALGALNYSTAVHVRFRVTELAQYRGV